MTRYYLKLALISIAKQKWFSIINIVGLAFGISLCLVIITIVKDQYSFDDFHPNRDRIYRINTEAIRTNGDREDYASAPFVVGTSIKERSPGIEKLVRLSELNAQIADSDHLFPSSGFFADPDFFQVFGFELIYGNKLTALSDPYSIILTEKTAAKLFNKENPLGRFIELKGLGNYTIRGVMKDPPGKTHLVFDLLASSATLFSLEKEGSILPVSEAWTNYNSSYVYVLLKNSENKTQVERDLASIAKQQYSSTVLGSGDKGFVFYLQALNKIVPGPTLNNNMGKALPELILWILGLFALIVIISASFNYASLSIARSLHRAKEIGIRKTAGAARYQLVSQSLIESIVTTFISLILAELIFHFLLKPFFESLDLSKAYDMSLDETVSLYIVFLLFSLIVALLAGIIPALLLSSLKPSQALKDLGTGRLFQKLGFRKVLLVGQFIAALIFAITLVNFSRQINYLLHADYGFKPEHIINIDLQGNDYARVRKAFGSYSGVIQISGISHSLGTFRDRRIDVRVNEADDKSRAMDYTIDPGYIDNLGLKLISGRNFTPDLPSNRELFVIVNESFLRFFHLGQASEAIGKTVILDDDRKVSIYGVLKDFHFKPFIYGILPLVFRYNPSDITQLNLKISGVDPATTLANLDKIWRSVDKEHSFSYQFFEDELKNTYSQYKDIAKLVGIVAGMSVMIAFLGLIALVFFILQQKVKEISIRKVLGASLLQLYLKLSNGFFKLLFATAVLGIPAAILMNNLLMQQFVFKINQFLSYVIGILLILIIAVMATSVQVWKAARANPVKNLRTE